MMAKPHDSAQPPEAPRRILERICHADLAEEILGDLEESFALDVRTHSLRRARFRYWCQAILFMRPHTVRNITAPRPGPIMLKNYLRVSARFMARHKTYAAINLAGLALGLTVAMLISAFVLDERSFDGHLDDLDRMYRLVAGQADESYEGIAKVNGPYGPTASAQVSGVEAATRFVFFGQVQAEAAGQQFTLTDGFYADSTTFDVFSWGLTAGDPETALITPNSLVLSASLSSTLFGSQNPLDQTVTIDGDRDFRVTGIMEDVPRTSHFVPSFLASMSGYAHPSHDDWVAWNQYYTYLKILPSADSEDVASAATSVIHANLPEQSITAVGALRLQPVGDIYLRSNMFREIGPMGDLQTVRILSLIAAFILLLAALNFVNLSTARATLRAREVGVRKSLGAKRGAVMRQFLSESTANVALGWVLALGLAFILLPSFNDLAAKSFVASDLFATPLLAGGLALVLLLGLLAGAYPSFVLSGFQPVTVMRGALGGGGRGTLRKSLVLAQFVISIGLLMSAGIVADQLRYIEDKPLGFDEANLVSVTIQDSDLASRFDELAEQMAAVPGVEAVSLSGNRPGGGDWGIPIQIPGVSDEERPPVRMLVGDQDYPATFGMQIVVGRSFDRARPTDAESAVLINEEFVRQLGWEDPIGKAINMPAVDRSFQVIGVMEDFHFRSAREAIAPIMLFNAPPNWYGMINARLDPAATADALAGLEDVYARFDPVNPFSASFQDQRFQSLYVNDQRTARLLRIATLLAFLVACLGLYGLAAHAAERRTREIGVRKAIGASVPEIVRLLTRETVVLIGIAVVLATPVAILFGRSWLEQFAYRTSIEPLTLLLGGVTAIVVGIATTGFQAWRAARMNPVAALRTE